MCRLQAPIAVVCLVSSTASHTRIMCVLPAMLPVCPLNWCAALICRWPMFPLALSRKLWRCGGIRAIRALLSILVRSCCIGCNSIPCILLEPFLWKPQKLVARLAPQDYAVGTFVDKVETINLFELRNISFRLFCKVCSSQICQLKGARYSTALGGGTK